MNWTEFITSDHQVLLGRPVVCGTRITEQSINELISAGYTEEMIFDKYPVLREISQHGDFLSIEEARR